jgi:O-antigen ligase
LSKALISVSFIGICLVGLLNFSPRSISRNEKIIFVIFILFYLASALSFFYSSNQDEATRKLVLKLPILVFPLACIALRNISGNNRHKLVIILNYAAFLPSIVSVYNYLANKTLFDQLILESKPLPIEFGYGIYHIQFSIILASAIVFGCFSIVQMLRQNRRDASFYFLCILTSLNMICIHILSARTGLLGMYFGLVIVFLYSIRQANRKLRLYILPAFIILPLLLFFSSTSLQNRLKNSIEDFRVAINGSNANDYSFAMRVAAWGNSIDVIKKHPVSGVGIGDADEVLPKNFESFNPSIESYNRKNPHNQVLENAVQSGLISSVLFILCLLSIAVLKPSAKSHYEAIAFVLLFFISSNFESILESQASVVAFSAFLALAYYFALPDKPSSNLPISG